MQLKTDATGIVATVEFYPATLQDHASATLGTERLHLQPMFLTLRIHQSSRQSTVQDAPETLKNILKESPINLMALHGKVD